MAIQGFFTGDVKIRDLNGVLRAVDGIVEVTPTDVYVPYVGATANVNLGEFELKAGQFTLDISPTGTAAVGTTRWNNTIGSSETTLKGGTVILKNGVDLVARVVNKVTPNTTLTKATYPAVRVSGAAGQRLAVAYAQANNDNNSADTIGLVIETIATNQEGFIMTVGQLFDINTTGSLQGETWVDGDVLYLSPTTPGALTNIKPTGATGHIVVMGYVEYAHANNGSIYVKIMNGWELDELHNVYISSPVNNQGLFYESATSLWKNKSIATVLGYTPIGLTSLSAVAPLSYNNTTGAFSISQASGSTNGYLSSTDWNTFNSKQAAGNYITALTGEATASGPGSASVTLSTSAVTGKLLTGLNLTGGGSIAATDSILQAFGKVQNQISGIVGGVTYQGTWNAFTNSPGLASSVGTKGYYYIVSVAGVTNLNGITDWQVGDWAIFNGSTWDKVDNTDAVSSVNGFTGAVSLTTANIPEVTNLYYLDSRARAAISLTTTGTSGAATYDNTTGVLNIPQYQSVLTNPVTGTGTTNTLPKFTGASTIGNSNVTDTGSLITLGSNSFVDGALGIGVAPATNRNLLIEKTLTGSTVGLGVFVTSTIASDVTAQATYFRATSSTQAATFTLSNLYNFSATQGTFGVGSTVTAQYGYFASSTLIGATNNYGFYGAIPSGANRWNLYMDGTANNYMAGSLGIGQTSLATRGLSVSKNITNGTVSYGITSDGTIQSDVTSSGIYYLSSANTVAASFTLSNIYHYLASQSTFGVGSTIASQAAFQVSANLIGATNNYGFRGLIPSGTGRFNLFMDGTAENYLAGNIGIGIASSYVSSGPILTTTLTNGGSGYVDGTYTDVASTVTSGAGVYALFTIVVSGGIVTSATLTWGGSSYKVGDTLTVSNTLLGGTGSGLVITVATVDSSQLTIANANGADISLFRNDTSLVTGDNLGTIKFLNNDASTKASGIEAKISAFGAGSAGGAYLSFFTSTGAGGALNEAVRIGSNGGVGIGGAYSLNAYSLRVEKNITGSTIGYAIASVGVSQSDVTNQSHYYMTSASTAAASYTLSNLYHYRAIQGTFGAGSTVTAQSGFFVDNTLIGATNNYGFFGNIASGTNRWNLYMNGTADNYLAGNIGIGGSQLNVSSGPILTTTLTNGGSGYVDGTYTDVLSTAITGNGTYALFTVIVSGGVVTTATLTWSGSTYRVGDTVTISNTLLGGTGSGLVITVNTVDSSQLTITSTTGADITLLRNDTTLSPNDNVGTIKWISNDSTTKASGIVAEISANGESTNGGAYLSFSTRAGVTNSPLVEAMRISGNGGVGIGATSLTGYSLRVSKNITGAVNSFGIASDGEIQSGVTTSANLFYTSATTAATTFTLTSLNHYAAVQGTFGAGSTVTNQYGFIAGATLTGATNNFGFYGNIASGTNRWNLYMNGTANNYLNGDTAIGTTTLGTATKITVGGSETASSAIARGQLLNTTLVAAANYDTLVGLDISPTFTNGSFIGVNNYALRLNAASGSFVWNLYASGTANNYMEGSLGIGTISPSEKLEVNGNIKTASPTGGTAQAWKLGEDTNTLYTATRTIRVEIAGSVYYLLAVKSSDL